MSMFYTARHAAPRTSSPATKRAGAGVLAATALGLGATTMTATSAAAQAPDVPASQSTPAPTGGAQSASTSTESADTTESDDSAESSDSSDNTTFSGVVKKGDRGDIVEEIQDEVGVSSDGVFGSETEQAVKGFQDDEGLAVDGQVGPETGSKLGLTGAASSSSSDSASSSSSSSSDSSSSSSNAGSSDSSSSNASTSASTASVSSSSSSSSTGAQSTSSSSSSTSGVLGTAANHVGAPYKLGGTTPSGWDCSGFTQYVFAQNGKDLPRTADAQQAAATTVSDPKPGDLVFFGSPAYHVGIYAGDGQMYDAGNESVDTSKRAIWTDNVTYGRL